MIKQATQRLYSLDAVRAIALLLGIVLHGTMSFLPELKAMGWPIVDSQQSGVLSLVFYGIHIFRMATFFIIAGFFAHLVFNRRGFKGFVKDRCKRILIPMLSLWLPIVIAVLGVFTWVFVKTTGSLPPPPVDSPQQQAFPLMHFWFLYILCWLYILALLFRSVIAKLDSNQRLQTLVDRLFGALMRSYIGPLVLSLPVVALLYAVPNWGWYTYTRSITGSGVAITVYLFLCIYFGLDIRPST